MRGNGDVTGAPNLTNREREVLVHIADGLSNKEIASALGVGVRTVETHRERIMRKLDIHNVAGLTNFAIARDSCPSHRPWPPDPRKRTATNQRRPLSHFQAAHLHPLHKALFF